MLSSKKTERDLALQAKEWRNRVRKSLFAEQVAVLEDEGQLIALETTRRAGKTHSAIATCIDHGLKHPNSVYAYIAITAKSAKKIAWPIIRRLDAEFGLNLHLRESRLEVVFPNGSELTLYGADKPGWAERIYGQAIDICVVDEAAFFKIDLKLFIEDYVEPTLIDRGGKLMLCSIPGHSRRGFFWDVVSGKERGWSVHRWTAFDNPHVADRVRRMIAAKKVRDPNIESTPTFRRNYLAEWVADDTDRVYSWDEQRNIVDEAPDLAPGERATHVLGMDMGWHDATSFVVLRYGETSPQVHVLESYKRPHMLIDEIADRLRGYIAKYPGLRLVGDPARRQILEEIRRRHSIPIEPADKAEKLDWIDLINTDLTLGLIKFAYETNRDLLKEMNGLTWSWNERTQRRKETEGQSNDLCDALLYAYRSSFPYLYRQPVEKPAIGSKAYYERVALEHERRLAERILDDAEGW